MLENSLTIIPKRDVREHALWVPFDKQLDWVLQSRIFSGDKRVSLLVERTEVVFHLERTNNLVF